MSGLIGFVYSLLPAGFGRNARLERISDLLDWARIEAIVRVVRPGREGRPPYPPLAMVRALLLQQWYGLSDPGLEMALGDRVSFRRFCVLAWATRARTKRRSAGSGATSRWRVWARPCSRRLPRNSTGPGSWSRPAR